MSLEEPRLPWNNKEGLLYGGIIALITCIIMMEFNLVKSNGFDVGIMLNGLLSLPFIWIIVMLLMTFIVGRIADVVVRKFTQPGDSFYTRIVFNIIACVSMMSMIMTFVGPFVGHLVGGEFTLQSLYDWPQNWPVNFCVAFWVEMFVAQPAARATMKHIHTRAKGKAAEGSA